MTLVQGQTAGDGEVRLRAQLCQIWGPIPFYSSSLRAALYGNVYTCIL